MFFYYRIVSYITRQSLPPLTILYPSTLPSFKTIYTAIFPPFLSPDHSDLAEIFTAIANQRHRAFVFGLTMDVSLAKGEGVPVPSVSATNRSMARWKF